MPLQPFSIVPFVQGLERDKEAFLLENDAFPTITDAYLYQGRIHRREGNEFLGRLVQKITTTFAGVLNAGAVAYTDTLPTVPVSPGSIALTIVDPNPPGALLKTFTDDGEGALGTANSYVITNITRAAAAVVTAPGHAIVFGDTIYIYGVKGMTAINGNAYLVIGVVGDEITLLVNSTAFGVYLNSGQIGTQIGGIDYDSGVFILHFTALPALIGALLDNVIVNYEYISGRPVMGLPQYETPLINNEELLAFDTVRSNWFNRGAGRFVDTSYYKMTTVAPIVPNEVNWTGANNRFFWSWNFRNVLWSTNYVPGNHGVVITGISQAASAVVTFAAGPTFKIGEKVFFYEVVTMTQINGLTGTVTASGAGTITVDINSAGFGAYGGGGVFFALSQTFVGDGIRYYDGYGAGLGWTNFEPPIGGPTVVGPTYLKGALMLIPYRDRMVALNTFEGKFADVNTLNYPQRARWSQNSSPFYADRNTVAPLTGPAAGTAWNETPGLGGYIDAPTNESIVSCGFYKDTLIVFFERSTWQLLYTSNETIPFVWQRVNSQFGCESTFSVVGFDQGIFAVGDKAIITSDSVNVNRIDSKIPTEVFAFHNENAGPERVHGIRDYYYQFVYWTFPNVEANATFPNRLLVFNYLEQSWSFYNDSYTCFGYFQEASDLTWAMATYPWSSAKFSWASSFHQASFPDIVAGNQQGFVMKLNQKVANDKSLYITGITQAATPIVTCVNHNLSKDQFVMFSDVVGMTQINGLVGKVILSNNANQFTVALYDLNGIILAGGSSAFTAYSRGGFITVQNNIDIKTKRFNPFFTQSNKVRISYFDIMVDKTVNGQFTVDYYIDYDSTIPVTTAIIETFKTYGPINQSSILQQRIYADSQGQFVQMHFYQSDYQMTRADIRNSDIRIHSLNVWATSSGGITSYDMR